MNRPNWIEYLRIKFLHLLPRLYQKVKFYRRLRYWPDFKSPKTICEIVTSKKLEPSAERLAVFTDKLEVRKKIENFQKKYELNLEIPDVIRVGDSLDDLELETLTQPVFVKTTHGAGIVSYFDPSINQTHEIRESFEHWLGVDYYECTGESSYKGIQRKVFLEEPLIADDGNIPDDIKVHCYYGIPVVIQLIRRRRGYIERATFNRNWEPISIYADESLSVNLDEYPKSTILEIVEVLATVDSYTRVDLYYASGKVYFGELTFFPESSKEIDFKLGSLYQKIGSKSQTDQPSNFDDEFLFVD